MNRRLFLLFLIITTNLAFSQQKIDQNLWHLTIVDSITNKGIEGANLVINGKRYFITNVNGTINLDKKYIYPRDSIRISCIGYQSVLLIPGVKYKFPEILKLSASVTNLKEVKIHLLNTSEIKIGDIKKSYNTHAVSEPDYENAQYIPNDKKITGTITSVDYVLNDELHGIEQPFAVRLYSKSKNSLFPDKALIKDSLIVYNPERKRHLSVDISRYNIQFPDNGIIVVFATLPSSYYGKDTVWFDKLPQGRGWFQKMPCIDMDQKNKNNVRLDYEKLDRKTPYCMIRPGPDKWKWDDVKDQFYVFVDGINFAISITVSPND